MPFLINLSADALQDIDNAVEYYNKVSCGRGLEFATVLNVFFNNIRQLPTASAIRYDNVRIKPIDTFPFVIHFIIDSPNAVLVLPVFNTSQQPFWEK